MVDQSGIMVIVWMYVLFLRWVRRETKTPALAGVGHQRIK